MTPREAHEDMDCANSCEGKRLKSSVFCEKCKAKVDKKNKKILEREWVYVGFRRGKNKRKI